MCQCSSAASLVKAFPAAYCYFFCFRQACLRSAAVCIVAVTATAEKGKGAETALPYHKASVLKIHPQTPSRTNAAKWRSTTCPLTLKGASCGAVFERHTKRVCFWAREQMPSLEHWAQRRECKSCWKLVFLYGSLRRNTFWCRFSRYSQTLPPNVMHFHENRLIKHTLPRKPARHAAVRCEKHKSVVNRATKPRRLADGIPQVTPLNLTQGVPAADLEID